MAGLRLLPPSAEDPARLGAYHLLGRLAAGGMGRVYVARSTRPDDAGVLVAVKTLLAEGTVSDRDRRRFAREVKLARRVDSAYTARVRDADHEAPRPWMAIDFIAAPSLDELVRAEGVLPRRAVYGIAAGIAQALVVLHEAKVVHRDVKPSNVLLPAEGPRLIDFGISHAYDVTRTSLTLGTIAFSSPEQARGEDTTPASDVYSLGATLFHLAVGRPPYAEVDLMRLHALVRERELDLTGLPKGLGKLIRPCLAAKPERRPKPEEILRQCLDELDRLDASTDTPVDEPWVPQGWARLIAEYEAGGRALQAAADAFYARYAASSGPVDSREPEDASAVDAETLDVRTGSVPPPPPTWFYSQVREAGEFVKGRVEKEVRRVQEETRSRATVLRERRRREREAKEQREAKERREADERREREAEQRREQRRRRDRERAARAAEEAEAAERLARERSEEERRERAARELREAREAREREAREETARKRRRATTTLWAVIGVLLVVAVVVAVTLAKGKKDDQGGDSGLTNDTTSSSTATATTTATATATSGSSGTFGSYGSSGSAGGNSVPTYEPATDPTTDSPSPTPSPTPDAADQAFAEVADGDCLNVYNDGYNEWSTKTPEIVSCNAGNAYMRVWAVFETGSVECLTGPSRAQWSHVNDDGSVIRLCMERQFRPGQCFLAVAEGGKPGSGNLRTLWDCEKTTVPQAFDYIMEITGTVRGSSNPGDCPGTPSKNQYAWTLEDGTMLCAEVA